jgi:hypothetical protein
MARANRHAQLHNRPASPTRVHPQTAPSVERRPLEQCEAHVTLLNAARHARPRHRRAYTT